MHQDVKAIARISGQHDRSAVILRLVPKICRRCEVMVGIGAGQMSRVDSSRIAARKAQDAAQIAGAVEPATKGSVVASDAFFPFADGLLSAVEAGATAVIEPGGSMRDQDVIDAADAAGIAMLLGMRHFRH